MYDFDLLCIGSGPAGQRAAVQAAKLGQARRRRREAVASSAASASTPARSRARRCARRCSASSRLRGTAEPAGHAVQIAAADPASSSCARVDRGRGARAATSSTSSSIATTSRSLGRARISRTRTRRRRAATAASAHDHGRVHPDRRRHRAGAAARRRAGRPDRAHERRHPRPDAAAANAGRRRRGRDRHRVRLDVRHARRRTSRWSRSATRPLEFLDNEIVDELMHQMREARTSSSGWARRWNRLDVDRRSAAACRVAPRVGQAHRRRRRRSSPSAGSAPRRALDLAAAGLAADERGRLEVDEHFQTAVPHIYAAGDVIGYPSLAATSSGAGAARGLPRVRRRRRPDGRALSLSASTRSPRSRWWAHRAGADAQEGAVRDRRRALPRDRARPDPGRRERLLQDAVPPRDAASCSASTSSAAGRPS